MDRDTATAEANYCGPGIYGIYSLRTVSGFFNVPQSYLKTRFVRRGLQFIVEKTRKSNHLQMSGQRQHFLLSYLKTLSGGLSPRPPAR